MDTTEIISLLLLGLFLALLFITGKLYLLYRKYEKASYKNSIYRIFYEVQNQKEPLKFKKIENLKEQLMLFGEKAKLKEDEIKNFDENFFSIVEKRLTERIGPVMNITGASIPSLSDLFLECCSSISFGINLLNSKESVISLLEDYELFIELMNKKGEVFENKMNSHIGAILSSVFHRMDIYGKYDLKKLSFRVHSLRCMMRMLSNFSCIEQEKLVPYFRELSQVYKSLDPGIYENRVILNNSILNIEKSLFEK